MKTGGRVFLGIGLLGIGWAVGYAQRPEADFMIKINAPAGNTSVECVSGCELLSEHDLESANGRMKTFAFGCTGSASKRCGAQAAGWLLK
jgi:hypothetical protein